MAAAAKIPRTLMCPGCHECLRWSGGESARLRCQSCGSRIIAFVRPSGECEGVIENEDAVAQMTSDWLRPNWDDEDDFLPEAHVTDQAAVRTSGPTEASGVPTIMPAIMPSSDEGVVTLRVPQPDDAPTRKVG